MLFADFFTNSHEILQALFTSHRGNFIEKILYTLKVVYLICSKYKNVALYKPISFVSEFRYMSNDLTSEILSKTSRTFSE